MNEYAKCPGCGLELPDKNLMPPDGYNASGECYERYQQLSFFTLSQNYTEFIHQLIVDAYGAQHSGPTTKSIRTIFSLIGLCLVTENNFTGRQVQKVHSIIPKQQWQKLTAPTVPVTFTVADVLNSGSDEERIMAIKKWGRSEWERWEEYHEHVRKIIKGISLNLFD